MKYRIGLTQMVVEEATVYVEADSAEEAEAKAIRLASDGETDIRWTFLITLDDGPSVASTDAVPGEKE